MPCPSLSFTGIHSSICKNVHQGFTYLWEEHKFALIGTVSLYIVLKARKIYRRNQRRKKWNAAGRDVVVLHGFPRATTCPNLSPFVLKVETYLRMAGLKYEYDTKVPFGPKKKSPWITINGEDISDSDIILDFLAKKFDLNFSKNLTAEQKGTARSMTVMVDEHLLWGLADWRIIRDPDIRIFELVQVPFYFKIMFPLVIRSMFRRRTKAQGIGLHSANEIETMMIKDIEALSLFLGNKPFLMGSEPCEADCAVFGMVAQFVWGTPGSRYEELVYCGYGNLKQYCFRMRDKFYPDWEQCLLKK